MSNIFAYGFQCKAARTTLGKAEAPAIRRDLVLFHSESECDGPYTVVRHDGRVYIPVEDMIALLEHAMGIEPDVKVLGKINYFRRLQDAARSAAKGEPNAPYFRPGSSRP